MSSGLKTEAERLRRQYELRKRRDAIIKELSRPMALSDAETLELTRLFRSVIQELNELQKSGAA